MPETKLEAKELKKIQTKDQRKGHENDNKNQQNNSSPISPKPSSVAEEYYKFIVKSDGSLFFDGRTISLSGSGHVKCNKDHNIGSGLTVKELANRIDNIFRQCVANQIHIQSSEELLLPKDKSKKGLADVVQIVKNLHNENAELTDRVNELTERVETLETTNKTLTEQLAKLEAIQKADIASMRTLIEVLRTELEEFKFNVSKQREDDEESEV